jgi:hypothetical protein
MIGESLLVFWVGVVVGCLSTLSGFGAGSAFLILGWAGIPLPTALLCIKLVMTVQDVCAWIGHVGRADPACVRAARPMDTAEARRWFVRGTVLQAVRRHVPVGIMAALGACGAALASPGLFVVAMSGGLLATYVCWRGTRGAGTSWRFGMAFYVGGCGVGAGAMQRAAHLGAASPDHGWRERASALGSIANGAAALTLCCVLPETNAGWDWTVLVLAAGQALGAGGAARCLQPLAAPRRRILG